MMALSLVIASESLTVSKPLFQIKKYATTKFIIINGLANRFSVWDKSVQGWSQTEVDSVLQSSKSISISIEEMIRSFFNYFAKIRKSKKLALNYLCQISSLF